MTDQLYAAAGWGPQPLRYWLPSGELNRRLAILGPQLEAIGIQKFGSKTAIDFSEPVGDSA